MPVFRQLMCISILASLDHGFKNPGAVVATECRRPFRCVQSGTLAILGGLDCLPRVSVDRMVVLVLSCIFALKYDLK